MATCNDGDDVAPATTVVRRQRREAGNGSSSFADWENAKYNLTFNFFLALIKVKKIIVSDFASRFPTTAAVVYISERV